MYEFAGAISGVVNLLIHLIICDFIILSDTVKPDNTWLGRSVEIDKHFLRDAARLHEQNRRRLCCVNGIT